MVQPYSMKKIIAIIRNECVEKSRAALAKLGVAGVAVLRVREKDRQNPPLCMLEPGQGFLLRGMLIMVVADDAVLPVVHALITVNQSGNRSDGEIFICPMVTSLEIGNAERSSSALL
jgi:nitrogen regulatory protein PII 2